MAEKPREGQARVIAVRALTSDILEVDLAMQDPPALPFAAGQWLSIPFGPKTVRAYSIASTPASPSVITLCADVAPAGIGSAWFRGLAPGAEVRFKGPLGGFVFSRADPRRVLFAAEEIGIVPIRSILTELYATGFGRPTALVYWARDPRWLVYDTEFRSLARRYPSFSYHPVVGQGDRGFPAEEGALAATVDRVAPTLVPPGHSQGVSALVAYVSGGGVAIGQVRSVLMARGLDRKAVRWEKFW